MKPANLLRHQSTKHSGNVGKNDEYYKRKLSEFKSSQTVMMKATTVSSKALQASYAVSMLVAKSKKPHSIVEELILPAAIAMAEIMIDKKAADELKKVPLLNNTVSRRIDDMSDDITEQVVNKIKQAGQFALQLDEMTDVSGDAQLLAFVRYKDVSDINEHILFCKRLPGKTTGEEMFHVIDSFFKEHDVQWKTCSHICTDGAAAMTGSVKGLFGHVKKHRHPLAAVFEDAQWVARLAYLADVFTKLNKLNLSLQGKESHILKMYDRVQGFTKKLKLWERKCDEGDVRCFPLLDAHLATTDVARAPVVKLVQAHLSKLCTDFNHYFPDIEEKSERLDWVRDPFIVSESSNHLPARLKIAYPQKTLTEFQCDVEKEYPELGKHALIELLPFGSTYMCEVTFSALTHIKTKQRNRLDVESSLVTAVSTLSPDLSKLMKNKQAQVSH
ncbi:protein FAM200A-like [Scomber japonicus]|uniref:protein FAM200A-like n=1 Tax=Scomber japonicus TaxID=13676 RepID=UPI002306CB57|nr:protein FAM200A-like [Scomber japonicus]